MVVVGLFGCCCEYGGVGGGYECWGVVVVFGRVGVGW